MSDDARLEALRSGIRQAQEALDSLEPAQREQAPEPFERLTAALDYGLMVVEETDATLLGQGVHGELVATLGEIAGNPANAAVQADPYADRLLDGLSRLPPAQGRALDQTLRDAAGNF